MRRADRGRGAPGRAGGRIINGTGDTAGSAFGYSMRIDRVMAVAFLRLLLLTPLVAVIPLVGALAQDAQLPPDPRLSVALAALLGGLALTLVGRSHRASTSSAGSGLPTWPAALGSLLLWTAAIALANSALSSDLGWYGMTLAVPAVVASFVGRPAFAAVVVVAAIVGFAASAGAAHQHGRGEGWAVFGFAALAIAASVTTGLLARALARDHDERTCLARVAAATAGATTIEAGLAEVAAVLAHSPLAGRRPTQVGVTRHQGQRRARLGLATLTWHDDDGPSSTTVARGDIDADGVHLVGLNARVETGDGSATTYAFDLELTGPLDGDARRRGRDHLAAVALQVQALVERVRAVDELNQIGQTDETTGLPTRRAVLRRLELERAETTGDGRLAIALVGLDDLAGYTERFGPPEATRLATDLGAMLSTRVRGTDLVARYDESTFCLVLPTTTSKGAVHLVDELHTWAALLRPGQPVTFSAGVAEWDGDEPVRSLLGRVEEALRTAEAEGQDRTVVAPDAGSSDGVSDPATAR